MPFQNIILATIISIMAITAMSIEKTEENNSISISKQ